MRLVQDSIADDDVPLTNDEEKVPFINTMNESDINTILQSQDPQKQKHITTILENTGIDSSKLKIKSKDNKNKNKNNFLQNVNLLSMNSKKNENCNDNTTRILTKSEAQFDSLRERITYNLIYKYRCKQNQLIDICFKFLKLLLVLALLYAIYHTYVYTREYLKNVKAAKLSNINAVDMNVNMVYMGSTHSYSNSHGNILLKYNKNNHQIIDTTLPVQLWFSDFIDTDSIVVDKDLKYIESNDNKHWYNIGFNAKLFDMNVNNVNNVNNGKEKEKEKEIEKLNEIKGNDDKISVTSIEIVASVSQDILKNMVKSSVNKNDNSNKIEYNLEMFDFAIGFATKDVIDSHPNDNKIDSYHIGMYNNSWDYFPLTGEIYKAQQKSSILLKTAKLEQKIKLLFYSNRKIDIFISNINQGTIDLSTFLKSKKNINEKGDTNNKEFYPAISMFGKGLVIKILDFTQYTL